MATTSTTMPAGHAYTDHVSHMLGADVAAPTQGDSGGYAFLNANYVIARSPISGLRPVIEQAIKQVKAQNPNLTGDALESKIAQTLTGYNDWAALTEETQAEIQILTGINFDDMTEAERETTINHLIHSPIPFGDIKEVLKPSVKIDLGYTHTLDKDKTLVEKMADGTWKITMISNNNNGSHTGHSLGSFTVDLGANADAGIAKTVGNSMVTNTNDNTKLYLDQAARDVLYGTVEQLDLTQKEFMTMQPGHTFVDHASHMYGEALTETQKEYVGYTFLNDKYVVARSTISALRPAIEQAINEVKKANPNLTGDALESKIAQTLTGYNDWANLNEETQAELMIMTGYNFDSMSAADQEKSINHLIHSPISFGYIEKALTSDVKIDMGYTHTLDKDKTLVEYLGNSIYKVSMISNNNNGSHTGHTLGSFNLDLSKYAGNGATPVTASATSDYGVTYNAANYRADKALLAKDGQEFYFANTNVGDVTITLGYASAMKASGIHLDSGASGYLLPDVKKVEGQDAAGNWHVLWEGRAGASQDKVDISFAASSFEMKNIRVVVDTNANANWDAIDVIKLKGAGTGGAGLEAIAKELGNAMVSNTNDNTKLYLDQAARDILYGTLEQNDFTVDNPFSGGGGTGHGGHAHAVNGTANADNLDGTDANDAINAMAGDDKMFGRKGNDVIDGGAGNDTAFYDGKKSDYTFTFNADGSVSVAHATYGTDTLKNVEYVAFTGEANKAYSLADIKNPPVDDGSIKGTAGDDALEGTDGNDTILAGDGNDVMYGGKGDDVLDGQGGDYNQADFSGYAKDYKFVKNADGSFTVTSTGFGTDTLKNVSGVWFYDEAKWYSVEELAAGTGGGGGDTGGHDGEHITGTAGDDVIEGTAGADHIKGGDGNDVMYGNTGNDYLDGEGGDYNQADYAGYAKDYTFTKNADGTVKVVSTNFGTDTLANIDGIWFYDEAKWYSVEELSGTVTTPVEPPATGGTINGTDGNDALAGTDGNDTMSGGLGDDTFYAGKGDDKIVGGEGYNQVDYDGKAADYHVTVNADGSVTVQNATYGTDTLTDVQGLWFGEEGMWYDPAALAGAHAH